MNGGRGGSTDLTRRQMGGRDAPWEGHTQKVNEKLRLPGEGEGAKEEEDRKNDYTQ